MSSKKRVFIYTSDISSFIGQNKWDFVTPFERLWKRCDPHYSELITNMKTKSQVLQTEIDSIKLKECELQDDLDNKRITKRQYALRIKALEQQKSNTAHHVKNINSRIDDIDLTHQAKLEKLVGCQVVENLNSNVVETNTKRMQITQTVDAMDINDETKQNIIRSAESYINKTHGNLKENDAIQMFEKKFGVALDTSQQLLKMYLQDISQNSAYDWYICGKVDGLYIDPNNPENNYIVEVKSRTKCFFTTLRDYENTQIQLYTQLLQIPRAKLVEKLGSKIRVTNVYQDNECIKDIFSKLQIFIQKFENCFLRITDLKKDYLLKTSEEKQSILRRLYLADITQYENQKLENDVPCMISDDLD